MSGLRTLVGDHCSKGLSSLRRVGNGEEIIRKILWLHSRASSLWPVSSSMFKILKNFSMIKMARRKFEVGRTSYPRPVVFNLENLRKMAHSPKKNKQVVKAICIISGTKVSPKSLIVDPE